MKASAFGYKGKAQLLVKPLGLSIARPPLLGHTALQGEWHHTLS